MSFTVTDDQPCSFESICDSFSHLRLTTTASPTTPKSKTTKKDGALDFSAKDFSSILKSTSAAFNIHGADQTLNNEGTSPCACCGTCAKAGNSIVAKLFTAFCFIYAITPRDIIFCLLNRSSCPSAGSNKTTIQNDDPNVNAAAAPATFDYSSEHRDNVYGILVDSYYGPIPTNAMVLVEKQNVLFTFCKSYTSKYSIGTERTCKICCDATTATRRDVLHCVYPDGTY